MGNARKLAPALCAALASARDTGGVDVLLAAPRVPKPSLEQLDYGGRLVIPVGGIGAQYLERWLRHDDQYAHGTGVPVAFVPLRGKHGWKEEQWWR